MHKGYFGVFGGQYIPELLMPPLAELESAIADILPTQEFQNELKDLLKNFAGRSTPLTKCHNLSKKLGFNLWLKREDLLHTGAHKINNTLGQALLAKYMGKTHLLAETGAGQHGVATAAAAAKLGLGCKIFMGAIDVARQNANVKRMKLLGADVVAVEHGSKTLKDAINEALRFWLANQKNYHYCFGTAAGPHPFPTLVRDFQKVIGEETKKQLQKEANCLPDYVIACVGGGSNAIGMFYEFIKDSTVKLIGIESSGTGEANCYNAAPLNFGRPGILHGQLSMLLQDDFGQVLPTHSISAGLDYPGVGPEHAHLQNIKRAEYKLITDSQALNALKVLTREEGIIPALESSHALAWALSQENDIPKNSHVVICLSGRGDKDMDIIAQNML